MSYQEKNITVSLFSHLLILGLYLVNLFQMVQGGGLVANSLLQPVGNRHCRSTIVVNILPAF
jgi:hypothetical protein